MTTFKQQLEQAARASYDKDPMPDATVCFKAGARWTLQSEAMKQVESRLVSAKSRLETEPSGDCLTCSFGSLQSDDHDEDCLIKLAAEALALLREMREGVE